MQKNANSVAMEETKGQRIKVLRERKQITQKILADVLNISIRTLQNWESEVIIPSDGKFAAVMDTLSEMFDFKEANSITHSRIEDMSSDGYFLEEKKLLVRDTDEHEYKPIKAKAGLKQANNTQAAIRSLFTMSLPDFEPGRYDMFEVDGNSMRPTLAHGDRILCRFIKDWSQVKSHRIYFIVTSKDKIREHYDNGVFVKRIVHRADPGYFNCMSDNQDTTEPYNTFRLSYADVLEIWSPVMKLTHDFSDPNRDLYSRLDAIEQRIEDLENNRYDQLKGN